MAMVKCLNCGETATTNAPFCWNCGKPVLNPSPAAVAASATSGVLQLDCNACKTNGSMSTSRVPRFSSVVRIIGVILLIPSFLGIAFAALMLISTVMATSSMPTATSDAELAGRSIGFGIGFLFSIVVGIVSLVGGLVGWLLLLNRNVWKCLRCGYILDRA